MTEDVVHDPVLATVDRVAAALSTSRPLPVDGAVLDDAESRRGGALLAESGLADEAPARLARDHARLFVGHGGRSPIAPLTAPARAAEALATLREEMAGGGLAVPARATDLVDALRLFAAVGPVRPDEPRTHDAWRHRLLHEHLLTWGTRCLSRMQLGAQTFFYQGIAAVGLGLLRHVSGELHWSSAAS